MPRSGALTVADYPGDIVRLACSHCPRRGQYRKETLIGTYGRDVALPDLRALIAACPRAGSYHTPCGVHFPELITG